MFYSSSIYKRIYKLSNLDKPLIIFDVETTGKNISSDRVLSLSFIKIKQGGKIVQKNNYFFNPNVEIDPEATSIHGIKADQVKNSPCFKEKAQEIFDIFLNCFYAGYNVKNFDLPILRREFLRQGMNFEYDENKVIDSKRIFRFMVPQTLSAAYRYYCGKNYNSRYSSLKDTEVSAEILLQQLEKYEEIREPDFLKQINDFDEEELSQENTKKFFWKNGMAYFAFSKYQGQSVYEVAKKDPQFLHFMMKADFSQEVKVIVKRVLRKVAM